MKVSLKQAVRSLASLRLGCLATVLLLGGLGYAWSRSPDRPSGPNAERAASTSPAARSAGDITQREVPAPEAPTRIQAEAAAVRPGGEIQLCQALGPAAPHGICGLDCAQGRCSPTGDEPTWEDARPIDWQRYAQGEYVGHERLAHVPQYRLRVDDELAFIFRLTRIETSKPYELGVGDEVRIESLADEKLRRDLQVQPDGSITLLMLGQVKATRRTVAQLRDELEQLYTKYYKVPAITVTPLKVNAKLEDLRATVDSRFGQGGQSIRGRVTPEGTVALTAIGSVPAQGLTLDELKREVDERLAEVVEGMEVTPALVQRAPRYVYVLGEVRTPGRFTLEGPTTVIQAISLAGGWNYGANLRQTVVFRRGDDWRLMATMLDLRGPLYAKRPCPADEIWVNDSDIVVVPKSAILVADHFIDMVFTRGLYGVVPFGTSASVSLARLSPAQ